MESGSASLCMSSRSVSCQGLVVGDYVKLPAFHEVSEVLDGQIDSQ